MTPHRPANLARQRLTIVPCSIQDARSVVKRWHRHHPPPVSGLFAIGVVGEDAALHGVAIVGRPVARMADDGWTCEVIRVATDGTPNACSALYGAAWKAARALGWCRMITYTLPSEGGASLRGAGWREVGAAGGGEGWHSRPGRTVTVSDVKTRWEVGVAGTPGAHPTRGIGDDEPDLQIRLLETP